MEKDQKNPSKNHNLRSGILSKFLLAIVLVSGLKLIFDTPKPQTSAVKEEDQKNEIKNLKFWSNFVFIFLSIIILSCGVLIVWMKEFNINILIGSVIAGVLGCASSALLSALERKAEGWEFDDGSKHPIKEIKPKEENATSNKEIPKDSRAMFSKRMATFFFYRPMLGIIAALLIFFGFGNFENNSFGFDQSESRIMFLSLLAGLFAKSLLAKMKDVFESLIGKK